MTRTRKFDAEPGILLLPKKSSDNEIILLLNTGAGKDNLVGIVINQPKPEENVDYNGLQLAAHFYGGDDYPEFAICLHRNQKIFNVRKIKDIAVDGNFLALKDAHRKDPQNTKFFFGILQWPPEEFASLIIQGKWAMYNPNSIADIIFGPTEEMRERIKARMGQDFHGVIRPTLALERPMN